MSTEEIRYEINQLLNQLSDASLMEILRVLKKVEPASTVSMFDASSIEKLLTEDKELLEKLAK